MTIPATSKAPATYFEADAEFNKMFPTDIQALARNHWTPLKVAKLAAGFLAAEKNVKVLDIGSGVGKFCLAAAQHQPEAYFYGVEKRPDLVAYAEAAKLQLRLNNVFFINGSFNELNFNDYDHFYFYNSFYENLVSNDGADTNNASAESLYNQYNGQLYKHLKKTPAGTRLVTYHSMEAEVPPDFLVAGTAIHNLLKYWIKA